jgi:hypothetical protein
MAHAISRRQVIKAAAGVSAALATAPRAGLAAGHDAPSGPEEILRAYRKMRFGLHERPVYWWMKATKYGLVDDALTALYNMEIASFFKVKADGDGFVGRSLEMVYSTDVQTGERLDEWENPYTGKVVPIRDLPIGPNDVRYNAHGRELPTSLPGAKLEAQHETNLWAESGGIWFRDDTSAVVTQLDGLSARPFRVYDWPTYHARLDDVMDEELDSAPCTVSFQAVSTFQRWMGMGDMPGNLMTRGSGQKVDRFEDLPASFRKPLRELHPAIADDPEGALDMEPFRFER